MQPLSPIDARQVELLRMGDLLAHLGGQKLALDIAKRHGSTSQFFEAIAARTRETGPVQPAPTLPWASIPAAMPATTRSVA